MPKYKKYTIEDCKQIKLPTFSDMRGSLTLLNDFSTLPFLPNRIFWLHNVPKDAIRGEHAHRTCTEMVILSSGEFSIELDDGTSQKNINFTEVGTGIIIPPYVWCRLTNFSKDATCLVLASEEYKPEGYINNYQNFKEIINEIDTI